MSNQISQNIIEVRNKIKMAASAAGVAESDITLLGVTKRVGQDRIRQAIESGLCDFGENYVQEFRDKKDMPEDINWHFIGQLQTNKVKYIFRDICMLHSLDRLSLAKELNKRLEREKLKLKVLVQINIGKEPQKGGVMPEETENFITVLSELKALNVSGLMCMPPFSNTRDETIRDFAAVKKIYDDMIGAGFNMQYLSMGMSGDYEDAIKQGANVVRIGSAIFGERA